MKLTIEERTIVTDALREYGANLSGFLGKMRTASAVARLEKRVEQIRDLADRFEQGEGGNMTPEEIYDILPMTERTLLKRYKGYPFKIANDRGEPCAWYIYEGDDPIAVVHYYKGRKLVLHKIRMVTA